MEDKGLDTLEQQVEKLITQHSVLENAHKALQQKYQQLLEKNKQASNQVSAMIAHLKTLNP